MGRGGGEKKRETCRAGDVIPWPILLDEAKPFVAANNSSLVNIWDRHDALQ